MSADDGTLEALIRARLAARGRYDAAELEGVVAEAARLARDVAALRGRLRPADPPDGLARRTARAKPDGAGDGH